MSLSRRGSGPERCVMSLAKFPIDEVTLNAVKHALNGAYDIDDKGHHVVVDAEFNLSQLLDFLSGYDPSKLRLIQEGEEVAVDAPFFDQIQGAAIYEYPDAVYTRDDVIRALIEEVERLRALTKDVD